MITLQNSVEKKIYSAGVSHGQRRHSTVYRHDRRKAQCYSSLPKKKRQAKKKHSCSCIAVFCEKNKFVTMYE